MPAETGGEAVKKVRRNISKADEKKRRRKESLTKC